MYDIDCNDCSIFVLQTTPLHLAAKEGHADMVALLLSKGADITLTDHTGRNCLDLAVDHGRRYEHVFCFDKIYAQRPFHGY